MHVSVYDVISILKANTAGSIAFLFVVSLCYLLKLVEFIPFRVIFIDWCLCLLFTGGIRTLKRVISLLRYNSNHMVRKRLLIIGAGDAGEQIVRDIKRNPKSEYYPVGFIDDDPSKKGLVIHDVKVLGDKESIPDIVKKHKVDTILIAIPSAPSDVIREFVEISEQSGVEDVKILPNLEDLVSGRVTISDIRDIKIEDLLGRQPVTISTEEVENYLKGKKILITGAGGSIGSEICKQVAKFSPQKLILFEIDETELFLITNKLRDSYSNIEIIPVVGDITNEGKVKKIFEEYQPEVVFHSAAYKHVPMMEDYPDEAVRVNVIGTYYVAKASADNNVEKFVLISTDKAVRPVSVMGATKRLAEEIIRYMAKNNETHFVAVRFGNVLGSRGSVIQTFKEQIAQRRPITVTHPLMERYFMTVEEAVSLVLQAGAIGKNGEILFLDMGKPVSIAKLAQHMIKLSGLTPGKDVEIIYTGKRPGEKLTEELLQPEEGALPTSHEKIFAVKSTTEPKFNPSIIKHLKELVEKGQKEEIIETLKKLVPSYNPSR